MDVQAVWKLHVVSQSSLLIMLLLPLLVVSLIGNFWQYRCIKHERQHMIASERAKAAQEAAEATRAQTQRAKKAEEAAADQRIQQLYREIDNLSQASGRLLIEPARQTNVPSTIDSLGTADSSP